MTSYARNKVSNSQIKAYLIFAKTHIVHGFAWTQKPKTRKKKYTKQVENWKKKRILKHIKLQAFSFELILHQRFNNKKHNLSHKWWQHGLQISMQCPTMLAIQLEFQMLNSKIQVRYPPHVNASHVWIPLKIWTFKSCQQWTWTLDYNTYCRCHLDIPA
jgi:hypothetical protein